jgi:hypothetical protein
VALDQGHGFLRQGAMVTPGLGLQALVQVIGEISDDYGSHQQNDINMIALCEDRRIDPAAAEGTEVEAWAG